jgi:hypothetical protein
VRATTVFNRLLDLAGVWVTAVEFNNDDSEVVVDVRLRRSHTDKTAVTRLCRINWRTTGVIVERVVADQLDDSRLDDLYDIGVDEVAYRRQHHYLTSIADHDSGQIVWGRRGPRRGRVDPLLRRPRA